MAKATIIEDLGAGQYTIQRNWAGRENIQARINAFRGEADLLETKWEGMPQTTDDELFEKNIAQMQFTALRKKAEYLENNMPVDENVDAWCADYTEGLTGEVGTIDIAGEYTSDVNIRPGYVDDDELAQDIIDIKQAIIDAKIALAAIPAKSVAMIELAADIAQAIEDWQLMPEGTPDEIAAKAAAHTVILDMQRHYQEIKLYHDTLIATATRLVESLEATLVCLQSGVHYCFATAGELYPAIALGPWTSLLNQMIYPGWQKFKPLHRYATIIEDSIDYENNTCAVAVQPTFSLMNYYVNQPATGGGDVPAAGGVRSSRVKNYNVNRGDILGTDEIEVILGGIATEAPAREYFVQGIGMAHPGFIDFIERNPTHPISQVGKLNDPIWITDEQYIQLERICAYFDYFYKYGSDRSGYQVSDYWDVMYDIGDPWYWTPKYTGEPQNEFLFGNITLEYDPSGKAIGSTEATIDEFYQWGSYLNANLVYAASQYNLIGPFQRRTGDCEDFVLTKMQAIIEAGILPAASLQVLLCYVVNAGYHAVLGIQTVNKGFLISDQRDYGQLWEIEQLKNTHIWESMSVSTQ